MILDRLPSVFREKVLVLLKLRLDPTAQYEIRVYAEAIAKIVKIAVPLTWEAFEDYVLYGKSFSRIEIDIVKELLAQLSETPNWEIILNSKGLSPREIKEFLGKIVPNKE